MMIGKGDVFTQRDREVFKCIASEMKRRNPGVMYEVEIDPDVFLSSLSMFENDHKNNPYKIPREFLDQLYSIDSKIFIKTKFVFTTPEPFKITSVFYGVFVEGDEKDEYDDDFLYITLIFENDGRIISYPTKWYRNTDPPKTMCPYNIMKGTLEMLGADIVGSEFIIGNEIKTWETHNLTWQSFFIGLCNSLTLTILNKYFFKVKE